MIFIHYQTKSSQLTCKNMIFYPFLSPCASALIIIQEENNTEHELKWYTKRCAFPLHSFLIESPIHVALAIVSYNQSAIFVFTYASDLWNVWFVFSVDFGVVLGDLWWTILMDYRWRLGCRLVGESIWDVAKGVAGRQILRLLLLRLQGLLLTGKSRAGKRQNLNGRLLEERGFGMTTGMRRHLPLQFLLRKLAESFLVHCEGVVLNFDGRDEASLAATNGAGSPAPTRPAVVE